MPSIIGSINPDSLTIEGATCSNCKGNGQCPECGGSKKQLV